MGQLRPFARFYEVFVLVVKSSLKVLLFYAPCLLAFTFAFSILLKHVCTFLCSLKIACVY